MWVCINEKRDGGRQRWRLPSSSARSRGNGFVALLRARSIVLINGDSSCFHLDYSHFLNFQKQQREGERKRARERGCARLSPSHLPAFPLTAFETAFGAESCLHREQEQTDVIRYNLEVQAYITQGTCWAVAVQRVITSSKAF